MPRRYWILVVFVVGLALHNLVMSELWAAGLRGPPLTLVEAWKEALLAVALGVYALRALRRRQLPFRPGAVDALALAFAGVVVLYALLPQSALGGAAGGSAVAHGARHDLVFVGAYLLGRCLGPLPVGVARSVVVAAALVALGGLVEVYAVPLDWWRHSGAPGWYTHQLGFSYTGLSGLPENFVYNLGGNHVVRRLVSSFLSPLATAYMLCVALLAVAAAAGAHGVEPRGLFGGADERRLGRRWLLPFAALAAAGLLWTDSRSTWLALALGLVVLALARRRAWPLAAAAVTLGVAAGFASAFPHVAPRASLTPAEIRVQERIARQHPGASHAATSLRESSIHEHLTNLVDGVETVARHPQGYGLGNAGSTAERFGVVPKAGESTYTEVGVDTGVAGLALFVAFGLALWWRLLCRSPWVAASLAAVLALAVQTDVIGVPWLAFCLWGFAGAELSRPPRPTA